MEIDLHGVHLQLFPERAILIGRDLLIADLHLGKVNHFRKAGFPVPEEVGDENFERLIGLVRSVEPERVLLLGDLFHSHYNSEWEAFRQVISYFPATEFHLIQGNHDILSNYRYESSNLKLHSEMNLGPFHLTHIPCEPGEIPKDLYNLSGHIHPSVVLSGKGRQQMKLPCFYFGELQAYLPAFGNFTGHHRVRPKRSDRVYVIVGDRVIEKN